MQHVTRAIWALFSIVVHLCIGAGCYAFFVADLVDTSSAQFWAWVGAWPMMLIVTFWGTIWGVLLWIAGFFAAIVVIVLVIAVIAAKRADQG